MKQDDGSADGGGDAVWSERRKVKRPHKTARRATLPWTVAVGVLALGWGTWTRLKWQSLQHDVTLRVSHASKQGDARDAPLLEIEIPDAPPSTSHHYIEGPQWEVKVLRTAFRPEGQSEWKQGTPSQIEFAQQALKSVAYSRRVGKIIRTAWSRERWLRLGAGDHTLEVDLLASFQDEAEHFWSGSTRATLHVRSAASFSPRPPHTSASNRRTPAANIER